MSERNERAENDGKARTLFLRNKERRTDRRLSRTRIVGLNHADVGIERLETNDESDKAEREKDLGHCRHPVTLFEDRVLPQQQPRLAPEA